ncbi:glycosyltransferase family 1 protein [Candidatus Dojkabacteria bacterium]|jgi:hypothetical protein|nr:glycosyltransferase family 1 protein [Candidatus Dojkabacteria bacterium]
MNIAFHSNQLSLRGTEVSMYDYAKYNEEILGNKSIIIAKHPDVWNYSHPLAIEKFSKKFPTFFYHNFNEVEKCLDDNNVDVFYAQKSGQCDDVVQKNRKSIIHAVFQHYEPHGDVYAYISEWLGKKYNSPYVPYMVTLPDIKDNLRKELSIPNNAIVFGRHGGAETFNVPYVQNVVRKIAENRKDIFFIFLYTNKFTDDSLKNVIYLNGSEDLIYKVKFINTCDAMLHARIVGETFGLAVAEFSLLNKPVITKLNNNRESAHIEMLGPKGIYYSGEIELINIVNNFKPDNTKDWNAYRDYNPENIMNIFNNVFLK